MIIEEKDYLAHYGTLRKSGRYPWGSGDNAAQGSTSLMTQLRELRDKGLSDEEIREGWGMTTTQFRQINSIAVAERRQEKIAMAQRLKDKGLSNVAIGERMGVPESSVRALLAPGQAEKANMLQVTSAMLRDQVAEKRFIDVGTGVETGLGISKEKLATAVSMLKAEGYSVHNVQNPQVANKNQKTLIKVLAPPGTTYPDIVTNMGQIQQIQSFSDDNGRTWNGLQTPISVSSKRVGVRYAEEGGADADGVIYVRPGKEDLSLGGGRYAQVRVAVDGTHYLKGMAMYKDDLPAGVDLLFNTNKQNTGNKLDAMKAMKDDDENPFGAVVRQIYKTDAKGNKVLSSAMNLVNEEGDWDSWSRNLSSQTLSKQSPKLAKTQLDMTYDRRKQELDEILRLTNPSVRMKLLKSFSDAADSSAVHLKAAALPRSSWHVILPMNSLKENEIYAPNFRDGERVALIRYPHAGKFEIPELTVNNNHQPSIKAIGQQPKDAVAINAEVAKRLSGADFDGDAVLVIPNNSGQIQTSPALIGLRNFDPQKAYPKYEGMKVMDAIRKSYEMGDISNLITDMTIKGAKSDDLARAVRHSMVVIDAEKHGLNYKQSAIDNGIRQLKAKYQDNSNAGAATLISRARSRTYVPQRKDRPASKGGAIDPVTGKKMYEVTSKSYVNKKGKTIVPMQRSKKLAETDDAFSLVSGKGIGTPIESVYALHSNRLKSLANQARRELVRTETIPYSRSAKIAYANEVKSLNSKLSLAIANRPRERQAQLIAQARIKAKLEANPNMDDDQKKKMRFQELEAARFRTGAEKQQIRFEGREWEAIQAGAITHNKLSQMLDKADLKQVKELATPNQSRAMTTIKKQRAQTMLASGYTQAEVADHLGVSLTTLKTELEG